MLLSSPSFSDFLNDLSSNPQQLPPQNQPQQPESRQIPKDVNPYGAQQRRSQQQQHIGTAVIPEQPVDYTVLGLDSQDGFNFQPQVFSVLETPEPAVIDSSVLSGKTTNFVGEQFDLDEEKVEMPVIEKAPVPVREEPVVAAEKPEVSDVVVRDDEFENDPAFALYHDSASSAPERGEEPAVVELDTEGFSNVDIFGGIEPDKALARYELVDVCEEEEAATLAMARVHRISACLDNVMSRLEVLTVDL